MLRYDGYGYSCDFCGYPRTRHPIIETFHVFEKNVKNKVNNVLDGLKRSTQRQVYVHYPILLRSCASCGVNLLPGVVRCPNCGASQVTAQTTPTNPHGDQESQELDKRVYDYIVGHNGTISLSQAERDLSLSPEILEKTLGRLKTSGLLSQT